MTTKKTLLIIMTVAVLGGLGLYVNNSHSNPVTMQPVSGTDTNSSSSQTAANTSYRAGTYTGSESQTPYGAVEVAAVISGGKITDIQFLEMPSDQGNSQEITMRSEPLLKQATISAQSANIDFVSGATITSEGFEQSLQKALDQAAA